MKRKDFLKERVFYTSLAELIEEVTEKSAVHGMIIPGGRTPKPLYQRLLQHHLEVSPDFRFILSDERHCKTCSPDSNQGAIVPLLKRAGVEAGRIIVPDISLAADAAAAQYEKDISCFLSEGGDIDAAVLGVGGDGHTAGIFDEKLLAGDRLAAVSRRKDGLAGITCTPALFMQAHRLVFVLRGATKQNVVESMMSDPQATLAGRIGRNHPNCEIWFCLE